MDELIKKKRGNAWVVFEGFHEIYVRVGKRYIGDQLVDTIDLANLNAKNPGSGAFKNLVKYLEGTYPEYTIYVESVLTQRFCDGLLRMGFTQQEHLHNCFYKNNAHPSNH